MWQFAFVVAVLASILLLRLYAEKGTPYAIMIPVLISWSLGFFFFLVLPFDLEHALCRKCRQSLPPEECACLAGEGGMGIDCTVPYGYESDFMRPVYAVDKVDLKKWFSDDQIANGKDRMKGWVNSLARTGR